MWWEGHDDSNDSKITLVMKKMIMRWSCGEKKSGGKGEDSCNSYEIEIVVEIVGW